MVQTVYDTTEKGFPLIPFVSVPESANLPVIPYPKIEGNMNNHYADYPTFPIDASELNNLPKVYAGNGEWR